LPVTWTSLTPSIAAVSPSGIVTGVGTGRAQIQATIAGISGRVTLDIFIVSSRYGSTGLFAFGGGPYCNYLGNLTKVSMDLAPRNGGYASLTATLNETLAKTGGGAGTACPLATQALYTPNKNKVIEFRATSVFVSESDTRSTVRVDFVSEPGTFPQVEATFVGEWPKVTV